VRVLDAVAERGLMAAIEAGTFADVKRPRAGGRGYDGVFAKDARYWNPFGEALAGAPAHAGENA
jgi:beta-lysine 5,6-aminomutase alpha subunit